MEPANEDLPLCATDRSASGLAAHLPLCPIQA